MQSPGFVAVWLGAGVLAACGVPSDDFEQAADVSAIHAAVADEPLASPGAVLGQLAQRAYVKASNTGADDIFGARIALSADGSTLAVGAFREDSAATGVDGNQLDNSAPDSGAVYVFRRRGKAWIQQAYLKASNTEADDLFGFSVALSADGSILAVGAPSEDGAATGIDGDQADGSAPNSGAVYVFTRHGMKWSQAAYVKASNTGAVDLFGYRVALSADGSTLAASAILEDSAAIGVGGDQADDSASDSGAVYVFTRDGVGWSQEAYLKASNTGVNDNFGSRIALSGDGSALEAGAVYVLARSGSTWSQQAYVKASNTDTYTGFGSSVALSADGSVLAVGADGEASAASGIDGDQTDNSMGGAGAVYMLARSGSTWSQQAYVKASNPDAVDYFGIVALSADGSILAVGAPEEDSAALGIGGDQTDNSAPNAGAVYVFDRRH
jgi:FG-GAP repeat